MKLRTETYYCIWVLLVEIKGFEDEAQIAVSLRKHP